MIILYEQTYLYISYKKEEDNDKKKLNLYVI